MLSQCFGSKPPFCGFCVYSTLSDENLLFDHQFAWSKLEQPRWPVRASIRMIRVKRRERFWTS